MRSSVAQFFCCFAKEEGVVRSPTRAPSEHNDSTVEDTSKSVVEYQDSEQNENEISSVSVSVFPELDIGYKDKKKGMKGGSANDEEDCWEEMDWVPMDQPVPCAYQEYIRDKVHDYQKFPIGTAHNDNSGGNGMGQIDMPVEMRGITLRQLRAVLAVVERMCEEGTMMSTNPNIQPKVPLKLEEVTLYDINVNIILPYTAKSKKSFVETLPSTAGTQPPRWFISHWWGEQFTHTMACIDTLYKDFAANISKEQFARGGGMVLDSTVWICAMANNQHDLSDITEDPADSGFARAMEVAEYRTASILDERAIVFTRIWCIEELYLTHIFSQKQKKKYQTRLEELEGEGKEVTKDDVKSTNFAGLWAIYTALHHEVDDEEHEALCIVSGGTSADGGDGTYTAAREDPFPMERIYQSRSIQVQTAQASVDSDRKHILNSIVGAADLNAEPTQHHDSYDLLNNSVRGAFACTIPALRGSLRDSFDEFEKTLDVMSKSGYKDKLSFNFEVDHGWDDMEVESAVKLIQHLPASIEGLELLYAPFGSPFFNAVADFIENKAQNLKTLEIWYSTCGAMESGKDTGVRLAKAIGNCTTILKLELFQTELVGSLTFSEWEAALKKNRSLKDITIEIMPYYLVEQLDEDDMDEDETVEYGDDYRQRIYCKNRTFPNATLSQKEMEKLKAATSAIRAAIELGHDEDYDISKASGVLGWPALRRAYDESDEEFMDMLYAMSKSNSKETLKFRFDSEYGWEDLEVESAVKVIKHLPRTIEGLVIQSAPFGSPFLNAITDFIENKAQNLKTLEISYTTCGAMKDGKESGSRLAKAIGNCGTIEKLELCQTELVGSLNFLHWEAALKNNVSLKEVNIYFMPRDLIEDLEELDEDEFDEDGTVAYAEDYRQRLYYKDGTFPNGTMTIENMEKLKSATNAKSEIESWGGETSW